MRAIVPKDEKNDARTIQRGAPTGLARSGCTTTDRGAPSVWVTPAGRLKELFDALHDLADVDEAMRRSALHDAHFVR
jgi:hypothetical protein